MIVKIEVKSEIKVTRIIALYATSNYVYLIYAITSQASTYSTKKYLLQCCKRHLAVQSPQTHFRHTAWKHITVNSKM